MNALLQTAGQDAPPTGYGGVVLWARCRAYRVWWCWVMDEMSRLPGMVVLYDGQDAPPTGYDGVVLGARCPASTSREMQAATGPYRDQGWR